MEIIGINHKTAPIDIREKLSFTKPELEAALLDLKQRSNINEGVILSTCNRVEIYALSPESAHTNQNLQKFLSDFHKVSDRDFKEHVYHHSGINAVKHLFRVSSSLDSQILGENQILGQVKEAYFKAREAGSVAKGFSFIFEEAIGLGKKARTQTQIGRGAVSIGTAAVEMSKKIFEELSDKCVLIIGAGKIGELCTNSLHSRGAKMVLVANRTYSRAVELAKKFNGRAIHFDRFKQELQEADIVISSVSAPHILIDKKMAQELIVQRRQKPIFFIDLGLPRNIDAKANFIDNVYVYNLDDLNRVRDVNLKERLKEAEKIEGMIEEKIESIQDRLQALFKNER